MAKTKVGKSKLDYYVAFQTQAELAHKESSLLLEVAQNFTTAADIADYLPRAHEIEHEADNINHAVLHAIDVDFVTPFDRTDIIEITNALDDIVDSIEEVIQRLYMFDVRFMHPDLIPLAELLQKSTGILLEAMGEFQSFKKFGAFIEHMEKVNTVEEDADEAYMQTMRRLYTEEHENPVRLMVWSDIFEHVENCADRIDETAALMGNIILKNS
ncbi:MAG: DUF47 family protein [Coriobacteriaceae bacterium]|nr:DUF47 family protein [Coriobacteriaceae bacterium]MDO4890122.1 DUF47 family protein [Coriobacteriaceae bacterium]